MKTNVKLVRESKVFWGNAILLKENAKVLLMNAKHSRGKQREQKTFKSEHKAFWGNAKVLASGPKDSKMKLNF